MNYLRKIMDDYTTKLKENPTLQTIFKRRSIRAYKNQQIPQDQKDLIIQGAMRAPTAGNMMMYSIIEVQDQNFKDKLVKTCDNQPMIAKAPLVLLFLADLQRWYDYFEISDVKKYCVKENLEYRTPQESDLMLACCDALIAAENAVITAEALGIGSCYIGDIMENFEIHQEMFALPQWTFPITLICFGFPKNEDPNFPLRKRFPQKSIHYIDRYRKLTQTELLNAFKHLEPPSGVQNLPKNAQNLGQFMYARKTGSDFSKEMIRSVKEALKSWLK